MSRIVLALVIFLISCQNDNHPVAPRDYSEDLAFLKKHSPGMIELSRSNSNARVAVAPFYQGRVMTSTATGMSGTSFGWINYTLIASQKFKDQFNPVGGEERMWLGPEGGQFSLYFPRGDSFSIENWQVPAVIDTIPWLVSSKSDTSVTFEVRAQLVNYSGNHFDIGIQRRIDLLRTGEIAAELDVAVPSTEKIVAYRTINTLTNMGSTSWTHETGLISIWLLGMLTPSESATVLIPLPKGVDRTMINTSYFGEIPPDRVSIKESTLLFKCDGKYRSKIGIPPKLANSKIGSYDSERQILTLVSLQVNNNGDYVNSKWELQAEPFKGDAINAYNDGPLADGSQLGPFYELESSSPAIPLKAGESMSYSQVTCHLEGDFATLNKYAQTVLGFDLNALKK